MSDPDTHARAHVRRRGRSAMLGAAVAVALALGACGSSTRDYAATSSSAPARAAGTTTAPATAPVPAGGASSGENGAGSSGGAAAAPTCAQLARTRRYIELDSASTHGGGVLVTYGPLKRICGGPDDGHYDPDGAIAQAALSPSTPVAIIRTAASGPVDHRTTAAGLAATFVRLVFGHVFLVRTNAAGKIVALTQQYVP